LGGLGAIIAVLGTVVLVREKRRRKTIA